jgi:hypothetical protein
MVMSLMIHFETKTQSGVEDFVLLPACLLGSGIQPHHLKEGQHSVGLDSSYPHEFSSRITSLQLTTGNIRKQI